MFSQAQVLVIKQHRHRHFITRGGVMKPAVARNSAKERAMVGPIFALELLRERRRGRLLRLVGWAYAGLLGQQIIFTWLGERTPALFLADPRFLSYGQLMSYGRLHGSLVQLYFAFL